MFSLPPRKRTCCESNDAILSLAPVDQRRSKTKGVAAPLHTLRYRWSHLRRLFSQIVVGSFFLRAAWHFGILHSRVLMVTPTVEPGIEFLPQLLRDNNSRQHVNAETRETIWLVLEQRRQARMSRTRPILRDDPFVLVDGTTTLSFAPNHVLVLPTAEVAGDNIHRPYNWTELCGAASLGRDSRVVLTNAFWSFGPALALVLRKQCHVRRIVLVDSLWPNLRLDRMHIAAGYLKHLYRSIPHLRFIIPTVGLSTQNDWHDSTWLDRFRPTHCFHLPLRNTNTTGYMDDSKRRLYVLQNDMLVMDQLLNSAAPCQLLQVVEQPLSFQPDLLSQRLVLALIQHHSSVRVSQNITVRQLELPAAFGPAVVEQHNVDGTLYVVDALAAVFTALASPRDDATRFVFTGSARQRKDGQHARNGRSRVSLRILRRQKQQQHQAV
jgi:hypothetical protein